jgi:hypothetical protein
MKQTPTGLASPLFGTASRQLCAWNTDTGQFEPTPLLSVTLENYARRCYWACPRNGSTTRETVPDLWSVALSGTVGTAAIDATGCWMTFTTAATINAVAGGPIFGSYGYIRRGSRPITWTRFRTPATVTSYRLFVGIMDVVCGAAVDPTTTMFAGLRYCSDGAAVWENLCNNWNTRTASNCSGGPAFAASTTYVAGVDARDQSEIKFWLGTNEADAVQVGSITSAGSLWNTGSGVVAGISVGAVTANARAVDWAWTKVSSD